jgi:hypothetical protein
VYSVGEQWAWRTAEPFALSKRGVQAPLNYEQTMNADKTKCELR